MSASTPAIYRNSALSESKNSGSPTCLLALSGPIDVPLICTCRSFTFPHELVRNAALRSDHDWRLPEERVREIDHEHWGNNWEAYA